MLLVTGCADGFGFSVNEVAPGISAEDARASRCAGWRLIELTAADVDTMNDQLVRSVLDHNINGGGRSAGRQGSGAIARRGDRTLFTTRQILPISLMTKILQTRIGASLLERH